MRRAVRAALLLVGAVAAASGGSARAAELDPACAARDLVSRVVVVRHKPVAEAALIAEPLLSSCGSVSLPKGLKVLALTDEAAYLDRVQQALSGWDQPPRPVELTVSLILASREAPAGGGSLAGELRGVSESLAQMTRYSRFERLGTVTLRAVEGAAAEAELGPRYTVSLKVDSIDAERGMVRLEPLDLVERALREAGAAGTAPRRLFGLKVVNLVDGRMSLVGAPARGNERALFLAVTAKIGDGAPRAVAGGE